MSSQYPPPSHDRPQEPEREPEPQSALSAEIPSYVPSWLLDTPAPESPPVGLRRPDLPGPATDPEDDRTSGPQLLSRGPQWPPGPPGIQPPWSDVGTSSWSDLPDTSWSAPRRDRTPESPWTEPEGLPGPNRAQAGSAPVTSSPERPPIAWNEAGVGPLKRPPRRHPSDLRSSSATAAPLFRSAQPRPQPEAPVIESDPEPPSDERAGRRNAAVHRASRTTHHGEALGRTRRRLAALANRWLLRPLGTRTMPYLVREVRPEGESTSRLVLAPAKNRAPHTAFPAGHFVWIRLDGPSGALQGPPFTIAQSLHDRDVLELSMGNSVEFTAALLALTPGREVYVEGPYGEVDDAHLGGRALLMICAGAGITSLMSVLRAHAHRQDRRPHVLVVSGRTPDELLFADELRHLSKLMNLDIVPIVSAPQPGWTGRVGRIDTGLLASLLTTRPILRSASVCLCGPAAMADEVRTALVGLGFHEGRIHAEHLADA